MLIVILSEAACVIRNEAKDLLFPPFPTSRARLDAWVPLLLLMRTRALE